MQFWREYACLTNVAILILTFYKGHKALPILKFTTTHLQDIHNKKKIKL